jgi:hypothetical protein
LGRWLARRRDEAHYSNGTPNGKGFRLRGIVVLIFGENAKFEDLLVKVLVVAPE